MSADRIKYLADLIMGLVSPGASAGKNYKQFPLPLAVLVCIVALLALGLLCFVGAVTLFDYLK